LQQVPHSILVLAAGALAYAVGSDMTSRDTAYGRCGKEFSEKTTALAMFDATIWTSGQMTSLSVVEFETAWCTEVSESECPLSTWKSETVLTSGSAWEYQTVVFWRSSDLSSFPSDYASSLAAVIGVPFGSSTTSSSLPSTSVPLTIPPSQRSGLSPGTKAGIGVGVCASVILGVVLLLFLWRRRKRQRQQRQQDVQQQEPETSADLRVSEIDGDTHGSKSFLGGHWRAETDGSSAPVEAGSTSVHIISGPPVELDATHAREGG